jgi:hypothetical protein
MRPLVSRQKRWLGIETFMGTTQDIDLRKASIVR